MATRIIEYDRGNRADGLQALPHSKVIQSPITASGSVQYSAAFGPDTSMVLIQSDEPVHCSRNSAATTSAYKVPAGGEQFFTVSPGQNISILLGS